MTAQLATSGLEPRTYAVRRVLQQSHNRDCSADLLFLEAWEAEPRAEVGIALRAQQIRRANPVLAAEIRDEVKRGRPLTDQERLALG